MIQGRTEKKFRLCFNHLNFQSLRNNHSIKNLIYKCGIKQSTSKLQCKYSIRLAIRHLLNLLLISQYFFEVSNLLCMYIYIYF